jgi:hypothetical protein
MSIKFQTQRTAISLAWQLPLASEEIAGSAAYCKVAPIGFRSHGISLPVAGSEWSGNALGMTQVKADRVAVLDRIPATVPGPASRGRPV